MSVNQNILAVVGMQSGSITKVFGYTGLSVYGCWDSGDTVQPSTE